MEKEYVIDGKRVVGQSFDSVMRNYVLFTKFGWDLSAQIDDGCKGIVSVAVETHSRKKAGILVKLIHIRVNIISFLRMGSSEDA